MTLASPQTHFRRPASSDAAEPPEAHGVARDAVKLLVARLAIALVCSTDKIKPEPKTSTNRTLKTAQPLLRAKSAFPSRPDSYVPASETVVTRETHVAWVFMSGERVYEFKKLVRFPFNKKYQISATSMWVWSSRQAYHVSSRQE